MLKNNNQYIVEFDKEIDTKALKQQVQSIDKIVSNGKNSYTITTPEATDIREDIFKWAVNNNLMVLTIKKNDENNLEQIFHKLTSEA
jgi:hypothetical protein